MSSEWETAALGETVVFLSGNTPSKSNTDYWGTGTSWISAKDMKSFWVESAEDTLTAAGVEAASRLVEPGTTLTTRIIPPARREPTPRSKPGSRRHAVQVVVRRLTTASTNATLEARRRCSSRGSSISTRKQEGRAPEGMDAALFPDGFAELGLVPTGGAGASSFPDDAERLGFKRKARKGIG
jgi:hypothetical protein